MALTATSKILSEKSPFLATGWGSPFSNESKGVENGWGSGVTARKYNKPAIPDDPQGVLTMPAVEMVEVIIYDAPTPGSSSCACGCGHHDHQQPGDSLEVVNLELQAQALAMTLEAAFPGRAKVEYINVLKDSRAPRLPQTELLASLAYPTPLVYINGQGRFAGALPVERIREEVGRILAG